MKTTEIISVPKGILSKVISVSEKKSKVIISKINLLQINSLPSSAKLQNLYR